MTTQLLLPIILKRSEWECFVDTPDYAIQTINRLFTDVLKKQTVALDAQVEVYEILEAYQHFGFRDSECLQVATDVINKYYGTNLDRWEAAFKKSPKTPL